MLPKQMVAGSIPASHSSCSIAPAYGASGAKSPFRFR